mmetsp:Transcript_58221/g.137246  ORF Transcript_58221/g.137246 Transcript_58221/m.137246 type:complete len:246 (+) Transcript_58221:664-1401(+)
MVACLDWLAIAFTWRLPRCLHTTLCGTLATWVLPQSKRGRHCTGGGRYAGCGDHRAAAAATSRRDEPAHTGRARAPPMHGPLHAASQDAAHELGVHRFACLLQRDDDCVYVLSHIAPRPTQERTQRRRLLSKHLRHYLSSGFHRHPYRRCVAGPRAFCSCLCVCQRSQPGLPRAHPRTVSPSTGGHFHLLRRGEADDVFCIFRFYRSDVWLRDIRRHLGHRQWPCCPHYSLRVPSILPVSVHAAP